VNITVILLYSAWAPLYPIRHFIFLLYSILYSIVIIMPFYLECFNALRVDLSITWHNNNNNNNNSNVAFKDNELWRAQCVLFQSAIHCRRCAGRRIFSCATKNNKRNPASVAKHATHTHGCKNNNNICYYFYFYYYYYGELLVNSITFKYRPSCRFVHGISPTNRTDHDVRFDRRSCKTKFFLVVSTRSFSVVAKLWRRSQFANLGIQGQTVCI